MDIMEEVVIQKVEQFTTADPDKGEWKIRSLADWVNLNFARMPEAEIMKAAEVRQRRTGRRLGLRWLKPWPIRRL